MINSLERFIAKIKNTQASPQIDNLNLLVTDIWSWCDLNPSASPIIHDNASDIEDIIANCLFLKRSLDLNEIELIKNKLEQILDSLASYAN